VEAGSLFSDLIRLQNVSFPCTQLKTCLRAELEGIISFASLINAGDGAAVQKKLEQTGSGLSRLELAGGRYQCEKAFLEHVLPYFPKPTLNLHNILEQFNTFRILSPLRKGYFGVEEINRLIWQKLSQQDKPGWLPVPIMITTNDYEQDLFNGETGVLLCKYPYHKYSSENYALFPSRIPDEAPRRFSACLLPSYEYAFCMSVHKSQGSEFDRVIVMLPDGSEVFGREVLYTAVTRARKHIEIFGSNEIIKKIINKKGGRLSGIQERLQQPHPAASC
jgi:exodeoxyribonuclease V alpha subunit